MSIVVARRSTGKQISSVFANAAFFSSHRSAETHLGDSFSSAMAEAKDIEKLFETDGYLRPFEHEIRRR